MAHPDLRLSLVSLGFLAACAAPVGVRSPAPLDYPAFLQACKDVTTDAVVMNLAAHPDDESGRSLVYLRRKYGVRTVTVYSTCGEGGQNAIGDEIGLDLARIRTRETLAAARITDTRVRWLGFADFGYSKTAEETFATWGKDTYLRRLETVLDAERPDLVLTNHTPTGGHGHHRASSIGLREVLAAKAKDGWVVPIYERASRAAPPGAGRGAAGAERGAGDAERGGAGRGAAGAERGAGGAGRGAAGARRGAAGAERGAADAGRGSGARRGPRSGAGGRGSRGPRLDEDIRFDVGEVDYMSGESYSRQASRAWREHRTQGMGGGFSAGRQTPDSWKLVHPANGNGARFFALLGSVFQEEEFVRIAKTQGVDAAKLAAEFEQFHRVLPPQEHVARALGLLPRVEKLLADLQPGGDARRRLGRRLDALQRVVLEGHGVRIAPSLSQEDLAAGSTGAVEVAVSGPASHIAVWFPADLSKSGRRAATTDAGVQRFSLPFGPLAEVDHESVAPGWLGPRISLTVGGRSITRDLQVRYTPVPRVALELKRPVRYVPVAAKGKSIAAAVEIAWNGSEPLEAPLEVRSTNGIDVRVENAAVRIERSKPVERQLSIRLPERLPATDESIVLALDTGRSELRLRPVDVNAPDSLFVGLIRGVDDTLLLTLQDLDIRFQDLDPKTLPTADLSRFTTLVVDIRAYRTRDDLGPQRDKILEFCKAGGRVLCFYHKPGEWNRSDRRPLLAPFDLEVGNGRVCEENAPIKLLHPEHQLFKRPNAIQPADFDGWVQERGLNFPSKWAKEWTPLMEMADTGEQPLTGALLHATYGKGDYIYCSLALYRQLRRGHVGAARLLTNLLTKL